MAEVDQLFRSPVKVTYHHRVELSCDSLFSLNMNLIWKWALRQLLVAQVEYCQVTQGSAFSKTLLNTDPEQKVESLNCPSCYKCYINKEIFIFYPEWLAFWSLLYTCWFLETSSLVLCCYSHSDRQEIQAGKYIVKTDWGVLREPDTYWVLRETTRWITIL